MRIGALAGHACWHMHPRGGIPTLLAGAAETLVGFRFLLQYGQGALAIGIQSRPAASALEWRATAITSLLAPSTLRMITRNAPFTLGSLRRPLRPAYHYSRKSGALVHRFWASSPKTQVLFGTVRPEFPRSQGSRFLPRRLLRDRKSQTEPVPEIAVWGFGVRVTGEIQQNEAGIAPQ